MDTPEPQQKESCAGDRVEPASSTHSVTQKELHDER